MCTFYDKLASFRMLFVMPNGEGSAALLRTSVVLSRVEGTFHNCVALEGFCCGFAFGERSGKHYRSSFAARAIYLKIRHDIGVFNSQGLLQHCCRISLPKRWGFGGSGLSLIASAER